MAEYVRLLGRLVHNLVQRMGEDLADCAAVCRRGLVYKFRSFRLRYDDVGPGGVHEFQLQPEQLALLVKSVQNKPWFCELDRKAAQDLVHNGGFGCFVVRPSSTTRSLTLTLWFHHRAYNILIRQREDGLLALGSKKNQEMTFRSVEEMVRHYEREPLILYSGGEQTGWTRLKAPPPGLVRGRTSTSGSSDEARRSSDSSEQSHCSRFTCSRTASLGVCEDSFSFVNGKRMELFVIETERCTTLQGHSSSRRHSSVSNKESIKGESVITEVSLGASLREREISPMLLKSNGLNVPRSPKTPMPVKAVPSLSLGVANDQYIDSTCL